MEPKEAKPRYTNSNECMFQIDSRLLHLCFKSNNYTNETKVIYYLINKFSSSLSSKSIKFWPESVKEVDSKNSRD